MLKKIIIFVCLAAVFIAGNCFAMNLDRVKEHYLKSEWKEGIREGERLLASANRDTEGLDRLYFYLGVCYIKEQNFLRASDIFEIVIKEFPRSRFVEQSYVALIDAYAFNQNFQLALERAETFIKKYPRSEFKNEIENRIIAYKQKAGNTPVRTPLSEQRTAIVQTLPPRQEESRNSSNPDQEEPDLVLAPDIAAEQPVGDPFFIQVGAFSSKRNADNVSRKLSRAGYSANVAESFSKGKSIFKVRVGAFGSRSEASSAAKKLGKMGYPTKIIP